MTETHFLGMTQTHLFGLTKIALFGLALSAGMHVLVLAGLQLPGGTLLPAVAVFALISVETAAIPLFIKMTARTKGMWWPPPWWTIVMSGCPPRKRYLICGFVIYGVATVATALLFVDSAEKPVDNVPPSAVLQIFIGIFMVLFSTGYAALSAAHRRGISNLEPKCLNGHDVFFDDKFCPTCGAPPEINRSRTTPTIASCTAQKRPPHRRPSL